jgi:hypothetical protein
MMIKISNNSDTLVMWTDGKEAEKSTYKKCLGS